MNRAEKAKATLDNDYVKSAFEDIQKECFNNIKMSKHDDIGTREDMYYMLRALDVLKKVFMHHIRTGAIEKNFENIKQIKR